jgi:hypothetical protein
MPPRPMLLVASTRGPDAYRSSGLVLFVVIAFLAMVHGDVVSTIKCQWRGVGRFQLKYVHTQLCCIYFGERRPRRVPEGRAGARYIAGDNWGRYDIGGSPDMGAMVLACALRQSIRRILDFGILAAGSRSKNGPRVPPPVLSSLCEGGVSRRDELFDT